MILCRWFSRLRWHQFCEQHRYAFNATINLTMALEMTQRPLSISVDSLEYTMREALIVSTRKDIYRENRWIIDTATADQSATINLKMALEMTQRPLSISVDNKTYTMREVLIVYTRGYNERKNQQTIDTATADQASKIHINATKECNQFVAFTAKRWVRKIKCLKIVSSNKIWDHAQNITAHVAVYGKTWIGLPLIKI